MAWYVAFSCCISDESDVDGLIGAFGYAGGSAGTNSTYRANLRQFGKWGIVPRMLVDATQRNHEVNLSLDVTYVPLNNCSFRLLSLE